MYLSLSSKVYIQFALQSFLYLVYLRKRCSVIIQSPKLLLGFSCCQISNQAECTRRALVWLPWQESISALAHLRVQMLLQNSLGHLTHWPPLATSGWSTVFKYFSLPVTSKTPAMPCMLCWTAQGSLVKTVHIHTVMMKRFLLGLGSSPINSALKLQFSEQVSKIQAQSEG